MTPLSGADEGALFHDHALVVVGGERDHIVQGGQLQRLAGGGGAGLKPTPYKEERTDCSPHNVYAEVVNSVKLHEESHAPEIVRFIVVHTLVSHNLFLYSI